MLTRTLVPLILTLALALPGCGEPRGAQLPSRKPDQTYTVRARVTALPDPGDPRTTLSAHHEAIDTFIGRNGVLCGMGSMTMDFPPARGVDTSTLSVGDMIELTLSVWWDSTLQRPEWYATGIKKLPADTVLEFRAARPPAGAAPAPSAAPSTPEPPAPTH